jgi:hypothetical protein
MLKLSITSKLNGIRSWSLQALDTCPGSVSDNGKLVDACDGCYATQGNYRYPNVKAPREHNKQDWQQGGKCKGCRKCWDKSIPVIGYAAQGQKMSKVIRLKLAKG